MQTYRINPTVPRGYVLNDARGAIGIIRPEATTNLAKNPSAETGLDSYSANGATIERVTTWQRRGAYGIKVTPTSPTGSRGLIYDDDGLTIGQPLTVSFDFLGVGGLLYSVTASGNAPSLTFRASGLDERITHTFFSVTDTAITLEITMVSIGVQPFYVDGLQLEHKAYATTYCDGDLRGFVPTQVDFAWSGTPHASTSTRTAQTRMGGRVIMLDSIGFKILSILGLGFSPIAPLAMPLATGGAHYQTTVVRERDFSLIGDVYGISEQHLDSQRAALADLLNPYATAVPQPLVLRYEAYDACGVRPITKVVDLVCHYTGGFEGAHDNLYQERIAAKFRMFLPLITKAADSGATLDPSNTPSNTQRLAQRAAGGGWGALGTGTDDTVYSIISRPAGGLYVGGAFGAAGGVANTPRIAAWTGTAWSALGTGGAGGDVFAMAVRANGDLIAAGSFTSMGGVANTARLARWNGTAWQSIATSGANGTVRAAVVGNDGMLYIAGDFTQVNGVAYTRIVRWDGTNWTAIGTGANASVHTLAIATNGDLLVGGDFTTMNGQAIVRAARYDVVAGTWSMIGDGFDADVRSLVQAPNGLIYAGGDFTVSGTISTTNVAQFGGTAWTNLADGQADPVLAMAYDANRQYLYVTTDTGYQIWNGSAWLPGEVLMSGDPQAIHTTPDGTLTIGGTGSADAVTAGHATVTNNGSADAYPTIVLTATALVDLNSLTNATTGAALYFSTTMSTGEVITLTLRPDAISMISSIRPGSILGDILPGSNISDWSLQPGANVIRLDASDVAAAMIWQDQYVDINQTVIR